jgi:hypothetical protein
MLVLSIGQCALYDSRVHGRPLRLAPACTPSDNRNDGMMPPNFSFRPRLIDALKGYDGSRFLRDLSAGVTVGIVALPLAMAFAIASGLKPEAGIFNAIIAGLLISLLGGACNHPSITVKHAGSPLVRTAGRNHQHQIRRHSTKLALLHAAVSLLRAGEAGICTDHHDCPVGRDRVAAMRPGGGQPDRGRHDPNQDQPRHHRPGCAGNSAQNPAEVR